MVGGRKRIAVVILIAVVSAAVAAWVISSRRVQPVGPVQPVLTEEEVRLLITEHPSGMHFEVKPETIEFLSVELVPIEESPLAEDINKRDLPDWVWVVEYECDGRAYYPIIWKITDNRPPPFTRQFVRVIIDAYTGWMISYHAEDVE